MICVSNEIKQQCLGWFGCKERERDGCFRARAVASRQGNAVEGQRAGGNVQPCAAPWFEFVRYGLAGLEADTIDLGVLMNRGRTVAAIRRNDEHFRRNHLLRLWPPFGIARSKPAFARLNPNLQKVKRLGVAGVELAMCHA